MRFQSFILLILVATASMQALASPDSATLKFIITADVNPFYGLYVNGSQSNTLAADFGQIDLPTETQSLSVNATIASNNTQILSFALKQNPPAGEALPQDSQFYMQNMAHPNEIIGFNAQYFACDGQSVTGNAFITANLTNPMTSPAQYSMITPDNGNNHYCWQYDSIAPDSSGTGYGHFVFTVPAGQWVAPGTYQTPTPPEPASLQLTICDASVCA